MVWTDTHCHLQFLADPAAAVGDAVVAGVERIVCVGVDAGSSAAAIEAADTHPEVYATVGLHPHEAQHLDTQWGAVEELSLEAGVVAIGECGLDYYRDHSPRDAQEAAFRAQIALAKERALPLVIHTRDAWDPCLAILRDEEPPERLVFHCFSGGVAEAKNCIDLGAHIAMAGPISYPNNEALREAARNVPIDRIVVETDAPFLSPQAFRGKTNYPARAAVVGEVLAETLGLCIDEVAAVTSRTAAGLFGLPFP